MPAIFKSIFDSFLGPSFSDDDLQLFTQLQTYSEFISNPLEILKKHFNSNSVK